jgi:hypothetical protein
MAVDQYATKVITSHAASVVFCRVTHAWTSAAGTVLTLALFATVIYVFTTQRPANTATYRFARRALLTATAAENLSRAAECVLLGVLEIVTHLTTFAWIA